MAIGKHDRQWQQRLCVERPSQLFYSRLNQILSRQGFDFAEAACNRFYAKRIGPPSLPSGMYFRLLISHFEGISSEPVIALWVTDSIARRGFGGYTLTNRRRPTRLVSGNGRLIDVTKSLDAPSPTCGLMVLLTPPGCGLKTVGEGTFTAGARDGN